MLHFHGSSPSLIRDGYISSRWPDHIFFLLKISHKWPWGVFDTLWNFICQASITYSLSIPTSQHRRTISNQLFFKLKIQMLWQSSWNGLSKQWFWYHFLFQLTLCYDKHQIHMQNGEESICVSQQQPIICLKDRNLEEGQK